MRNLNSDRGYPLDIAALPPRFLGLSITSVAEGWINAMQLNALLVFSVDVHVEVCPVARLRLLVPFSGVVA